MFLSLVKSWLCMPINRLCNLSSDVLGPFIASLTTCVYLNSSALFLVYSMPLIFYKYIETPRYRPPWWIWACSVLVKTLNMSRMSSYSWTSSLIPKSEIWIDIRLGHSTLLFNSLSIWGICSFCMPVIPDNSKWVSFLQNPLAIKFSRILGKFLGYYWFLRSLFSSIDSTF